MSEPAKTLPSDVMEMGGPVNAPDGRVDVAHLVQRLEADGFTILLKQHWGQGPAEWYRIRAKWPTYMVLGGRPGMA